MHDVTTASQAAGALRTLGDTAESVALTLLYGGWLGLRHSSTACPVALYLTAVLPDVIGVAVGSDEATIHPAGGTDIAVGLTPAVAGFVLSFDIGVFPELTVQDCDDNGDVLDL